MARNVGIAISKFNQAERSWRSHELEQLCPWRNKGADLMRSKHDMMKVLRWCTRRRLFHSIGTHCQVLRTLLSIHPSLFFYFSDVINLFGFRSSQQLEARTTLSAPWFTGFNVFSIFTIWVLDTTTSPKGITLNWSVLMCVLLNLSSSRKSLHLLK